VEGAFIEIGSEVKTDFIKGLVKLNENNHIIINGNCETSHPGIFAAGDVTNTPFKQIVVAAGEKIPKDVAQMLTRLEIYPVEIGMTLQGVYEDGNIFKPDVLDIDIDEFMIRMQQASGNAFNLAIEVAWVCRQTVKSLLTKAHTNAFTIAMEKGIINKETIKHLISKAHFSMSSLASKTKDGFDEDLKKKVT